MGHSPRAPCSRSTTAMLGLQCSGPHETARCLLDWSEPLGVNMYKAHVHAFEVTLHHSQEWLNDVMGELGTEDPQLAYTAFRATLQALRDRLPPRESVELGAQLPMLLRGAYYEGWTLKEEPRTLRSLPRFLKHVHDLAGRGDDFDAERVVRAVFRVLDRHVTAGEIEDVIRTLPEPLVALWEPEEALTLRSP